jgi:prepilin-type N-terminal cleavage/methylation domain-containing protein
MRNWNRLRAFTLIEMLSALAITSVVLMTAAYAFNTVRKISDGVSAGLGASESAYFAVSDMEARFSAGHDINLRFNDIILGGVTFDIDPEWVIRKQSSRIDTLDVMLSEPHLSLCKPASGQTGRVIDSLAFWSDTIPFALIRNASVVDRINNAIHGEN